MGAELVIASEHIEHKNSVFGTTDTDSISREDATTFIATALLDEFVQGLHADLFLRIARSTLYKMKKGENVNPKTIALAASIYYGIDDFEQLARVCPKSIRPAIKYFALRNNRLSHSTSSSLTKTEIQIYSLCAGIGITDKDGFKFFGTTFKRIIKRLESLNLVKYMDKSNKWVVYEDIVSNPRLDIAKIYDSMWDLSQRELEQNSNIGALINIASAMKKEDFEKLKPILINFVNENILSKCITTEKVDFNNNCFLIDDTEYINFNFQSSFFDFKSIIKPKIKNTKIKIKKTKGELYQ